MAAARRLLKRAIYLHDWPEKITIDKSGANTAAIKSGMADPCVGILLCQCKYLNNVVEQDDPAIKRITRPMLGLKSFWSARILIAGIETMLVIRKGRADFSNAQPCPLHSSYIAWPFDHQVDGPTPLLLQNYSLPHLSDFFCASFVLGDINYGDYLPQHFRGFRIEDTSLHRPSD